MPAAMSVKNNEAIFTRANNSSGECTKTVQNCLWFIQNIYEALGSSKM